MLAIEHASRKESVQYPPNESRSLTLMYRKNVRSSLFKIERRQKNVDDVYGKLKAITMSHSLIKSFYHNKNGAQRRWAVDKCMNKI